MTTDTTEQKPKLSELLVKREVDEFTWRALTSSVFPGAKPESILMAVDYCRARKLDILKKPVHLVPMKVDNKQTGQSEWRDVVMPGIAEARITAARTGEYAGQDEPEFGPMIEIEGIQAPEWCKVTVYRIVMGTRCPTSHREFFTEAVGRKADGTINSMWRKRKHGQLAKCREAGALRKAFPDELGGTYFAEEMEGQVVEVSAPAATALTAESLKKRLAAARTVDVEITPELVQEVEKVTDEANA